jgi:CheY-specific phosphatase CheX
MPENSEKISIKPLAHSLGSQLAQDLNKAVSEAFGKTFDVEVVPGRYEIGEGTFALTGDVSGIVGFIQEKLEGTLIACFQMNCIRQILPRILGTEVELTQDIVMDAASEITNMIFGQIKTELNQRGHLVRFGMPCVVKGSGHFIGHMHQGLYMIMSFDVDGSVFQIYLALHTIN